MEMKEYVNGIASAAVRAGYAVQRDGDGKLEEWDGTGPFLGICEVPALAAGDSCRCVRIGYARIKLAASQTVSGGDPLALTSGGLAELAGDGDVAYGHVKFSNESGAAASHTTADDGFVTAFIYPSPDRIPA